MLSLTFFALSRVSCATFILLLSLSSFCFVFADWLSNSLFFDSLSTLLQLINGYMRHLSPSLSTGGRPNQPRHAPIRTFSLSQLTAISRCPFIYPTSFPAKIPHYALLSQLPNPCPAFFVLFSNPIHLPYGESVLWTRPLGTLPYTAFGHLSYARYGTNRRQEPDETSRPCPPTLRCYKLQVS